MFGEIQKYLLLVKFVRLRVLMTPLVYNESNIVTDVINVFIGTENDKSLSFMHKMTA